MPCWSDRFWGDQQCPASSLQRLTREGHPLTPAIDAACHCTFEVAPDFSVCLKFLAVYAAAGPVSPPSGPFHDGASHQGLRKTAIRSSGENRDVVSVFQGLLD